MENKKKLLFFGGVRTMCLGLSCNFLVLCYAFFLAIKYYFSHMRVFVLVERWVCLLADIL